MFRTVWQKGKISLDSPFCLTFQYVNKRRHAVNKLFASPKQQGDMKIKKVVWIPDSFRAIIYFKQVRQDREE